MLAGSALHFSRFGFILTEEGGRHARFEALVTGPRHVRGLPALARGRHRRHDDLLLPRGGHGGRCD